MQGAGGIANLLFGEASFAGRLPVTWPFNNYTDQIRMGDMNMADWPGRGYRHIAVPVLYPFGHGLSYSTFQYSHLRAVPAATDASESQTSPVTGDRKVHVHVEVHNAGACHISLVYGCFAYASCPPNEVQAKLCRCSHTCFAISNSSL